MVIKALIDDIPVKDVLRFRNELFNYLKRTYPDIEETINNTGDLTPETEAKIEKAVLEFKSSLFKASE
jgi:F-type H+-transporting ATPase subunit alpha